MARTQILVHRRGPKNKDFGAVSQTDLTRNRPFPSSKKSHFQNEAKCEAIDMKMIFNYYANKTHFHNKGFALSVVLKVRFFGTRKWPISFVCSARRLADDNIH